MAHEHEIHKTGYGDDGIPEGLRSGGTFFHGRLSGGIGKDAQKSVKKTVGNHGEVWGDHAISVWKPGDDRRAGKVCRHHECEYSPF